MNITHLTELTERRTAAEVMKLLYAQHLNHVIEMLTFEPELYASFKDVDASLQSQKETFIDMTLEPLMEEIKEALMEALKGVVVQTISVEIDAEGLKDAKFRVSVPSFDDVPF